ncbi:MAG TPA: molybdate ABC transporter substrate-binding protein [Candidatus Dormibacteraeota bacterium]|nr:molybdate ABC transporter substrate-binding protein [Candidatus Dormibacteraeota bacterium]
MPRRLSVLMSASFGLLLAACGGVAAQPAASSTPQVSGNLTVLAAASLTGAFTKIGDQMHSKYPGLDVKFSFAGSPTLVTQIQQGAPADVFASADQANMQKVVTGGLAMGTPAVFAHNKLEIAVQAGNPKHITSLSDLANPAIKVDVCAPGVPCGTYSTTTFGRAGIRVTPVSQEQDVKSVLTKVGLGEADAGIVYVTDVESAGSQVTGVTIPDDLNTTAEYPIVELKSTQNEAAAKAFVDYVVGAQGQKVLASFGFLSRTAA